MNNIWKTITVTVVCVAVLTIIGIKLFYGDNDFPKPNKGELTIVEIGADLCIPCKLLSPIMEEIKNELAGKASLYKITLGNSGGSVKAFYDVSVIPVIIIYDDKRQEITRRVFHEDDVDDAKEWVRFIVKGEGIEW